MGGYADEFPLLSALGLYAADIRGDGNCLFNALSDQIHGHQDEHPAIRARVIEYMREHADYYKQFLDVYPGGGTRRNPKRKTTGVYSSPIPVGKPSQEDIDRVFEQHLQIMARGGTWGDNMEIQAFSSAFEVDVKIYQRDFAYMIQASESSSARPVAHIAYHTWEHYSSIRNLEGPHTGLPHVRVKALSQEEEQQQRKKLADTSPIQPWMINQLQNSLPYLLDRSAARKILEECNGNMNEAFERLLDAEDGGSASSAQESSSIEREPDSDDDSLHGPNKKQNRRVGRATRQSRHPNTNNLRSSRLAPMLGHPERHDSHDSGDSADSDIVSSTDASRSGTQETIATEDNDVIVVRMSTSPQPGSPQKPQIRLKLRGQKATPQSDREQDLPLGDGVTKTRQRQPGPRRITARDKKDMKKLAQKAARKERQQQAMSGGVNGTAASDKMRTGMALRSEGVTNTPPIESGFRTLFI